MNLLDKKIYMTAEDETEETLTLIAILEAIPLISLYESIDLHRNANCGFARAAKIFATHYLRLYLENERSTASERYAKAFALQKAMTAVANDAPPIDSMAPSPD